MVDKKGIHELTALTKFIEFIEDCPLIAYNAAFDKRFIAAANERHKLSINNHYQCALQLARRAYPHPPNHKLITVSQALNLTNSQSHRALADCHLTVAVYLNAAKILTSQK
jgi:DNA polymerase-3 subunit epsilon